MHAIRPISLAPLLLLAACAVQYVPPEAPLPTPPPVEVAVVAPAPPSIPDAHPPAPRKILAGVDVLLRDSLGLVRGRRVGLITNQTGVTRDGRSTIDALWSAPGVQLAALFAPEHGLRGTEAGGADVADGRDAFTGLPVFSLYNGTQRPTPRMLRGVDMLLFDMQDIGARPYTYVWTMAMAMEAAAKQGIPFVVLDRPNPITGASQGPLMEFAMRNQGQAITGYYPVPLRHGMTAGEIARYVNAEFHVGADLHVIPVDGWREDEWFDRTGLPWVNPSPNIRSADAALAYSGLVLLEATDVNLGRGTDQPFSYVGAPWLDNRALLERVQRYNLPGVRFSLADYVPRGVGEVPFRGRLVHAVHLEITDREAFQPVLTALVFLCEMQRSNPQQLGMGSMLQLLGSRWAPEAVRRGDDPRAINRRWEEELVAWRVVRNRYRLYPTEGAGAAAAAK